METAPRHSGVVQSAIVTQGGNKCSTLNERVSIGRRVFAHEIAKEDAAREWSNASKLSGRVWTDEMRFAPTRATGFANGVWTTYAGRIAKDAYMEVAFDAAGRGFCRLCSSKLGAPSRAMVTECLLRRIEPGSTLTHDGIVKGLSLADDWVKFVAIR